MEWTANAAHPKLGRMFRGRINCEGLGGLLSKMGVLKGLVDSLADTFVSRNNDVLGYWAMGLLYREAKNHDLNEVEISLIGKGHEHTGEVSAAVACRYQEKLAQWCAAQGIQLERAGVVAKFGLTVSSKESERDDFGGRFIATFVLIDCSGRKIMARREGWCRPHDPGKERRSARWNDVDIITSLRQLVGEEPVTIANKLDHLTGGGLHPSTLISYFKRAFPKIPLRTLTESTAWHRVSGGEMSDEAFNALLRPWIDDRPKEE